MASALPLSNEMRRSINQIALYSLCVIVLLSAGCSTTNKTQKGAAIGAGTGGIIGAFIGKSAGNTALGALIGGAVGGTAGAFIGHNMDNQAAELQQTVTGATVVRQGEGIIVKFDSGILFDVDKADVKPAAQTNLQNLAVSLQKNPLTIIIIIGHTDNSGTPEYNADLSLRRAGSVKDYLAANGVDATRLSTMGKGQTEPVTDNGTPEGRSQNRRVEIVILASARMREEAKQAGK